jgi:hypothetical protein
MLKLRRQNRRCRAVCWTPRTIVDLSEALGGLLVVGVLVGVVLEGELAVRPLDLIY